ncbi:MAG: type IX secretion system sortase PorU, partial [Nonlabens sp.]|nr:type IX secretion system sortase PorU [Nonlabens sp.]
AVTSSDYYNAINISNRRVANQNLKGTIFRTSTSNFLDVDYLIITPAFLRSEAQRLANYHITESNLNTKVVTLEDIYTEFSEGKQDIAAIRNFVKYVYDNASAPSKRVQYLNMFGDASFDYKNRIAIRDNIVPTFLSANGESLVSSYCTDDFFTFMDANEGDVGSSNLMDIAVGRMIVSDLTEAREMVDKTISYTAEPAFNKWRNNVTLIADDIDDLSSDRSLQVNVNALADEIFLNRPDFNVNKILLDSYEQVSGASGERYPDAVNDIRNAFEQGALVINYYGHGNEDGLAQEFVITQSLVRSLRNPTTLPLFITVTCEFTRYDNPLRVSGGELAYLNPQGGAIALVATNRLVFIGTGANFNDRLDDFLFQYDNDEPISMAESLRLAKVSLASDGNRRVIAFVGDPALKLASPLPRVVLTEINGSPAAGNTQVLRGLDRVTLAGQVQNVNGTILSDYNGTLSATIFDKLLQRETLGNDGFEENGQLITIDFTELGEALFRGQATIENGRFEFSFVMPRDTQIPIGQGRASFYAKRTNEREDQHGFSRDLTIGGINRNAPADDLGPEIQLFMNDTNFVSGGITDTDPYILAFLEDDNGINTSSGVGNDITATIDGDDVNPFVMNDYYEADVDDFKKGKVFFPLRDIAPGLHTLVVKAWDTYNNSNTQEIQFLVTEDNELKLERVLNYPNPFVSYTEFWFNHNRPFEPLDVQVQVMTVTGKVVWTKNQNITTTGFTSREITWDGRDDFGQRLGKGVYVYKITVKSTLTNQV